MPPLSKETRIGGFSAAAACLGLAMMGVAVDAMPTAFLSPLLVYSATVAGAASPLLALLGYAAARRKSIALLAGYAAWTVAEVAVLAAAALAALFDDDDEMRRRAEDGWGGEGSAFASPAELATEAEENQTRVAALALAYCLFAALGGALGYALRRALAMARSAEESERRGKTDMLTRKERRRRSALLDAAEKGEAGGARYKEASGGAVARGGVSMTPLERKISTVAEAGTGAASPPGAGRRQHGSRRHKHGRRQHKRRRRRRHRGGDAAPAATAGGDATQTPPARPPALDGPRLEPAPPPRPPASSPRRPRHLVFGGSTNAGSLT